MNKIKLKKYALYLRGESLTKQERDLVESELRISKANRDVLIRMSFVLQDKGVHILKSDFAMVEHFINELELVICGKHLKEQIS